VAIAFELRKRASKLAELGLGGSAAQDIAAMFSPAKGAPTLAALP